MKLLTWLISISQMFSPLAWAQHTSAKSIGPLQFRYEGADVLLKFKDSILSDPNLLPTELRKELELMMFENPDFQDFKVITKTIPVTGEVEIIIDQSVLRIHPKNLDRFLLKWVDEQGGYHTLNFNRFWAQQPMGFLNAVKSSDRLRTRSRAFEIASFEALKDKTESEKRVYWKSVRDVLIAAEALNGAVSSKSSRFNFIFNWFMGGYAEASKDGAPCIIAGWASVFKGGYCSAPPQSISGGQVICNPAIFGPSGGAFPRNNVPSDATARCDRQSPILDFVKANSGINKEAFAKAHLQISKAIQEVQLACQSPTTDSQRVACQTLTDRLNAHHQIQCGQVFSDSRICHDLVPQSQDTSSGITSDPKEALVEESLSVCKALELGNPSDVKELGCLADNRPREFSCIGPDGKPTTRFYCECGRGYRGIYTNSDRPTRCEKIRSVGSTGREKARGHTSAQKTESWFKPWMGFTLAAGVGLLLWYWNHKQTMKQYYDMWKPRDPSPPVAPPGLQPVPRPPLQTPPPLPVDVRRPEPGAQ